MRGIQQYVLSEREGVVARLVNDYKFAPKRSTYLVLARLMDDVAPHFPADACFVPIPTSSVHLRQRGFDHTRDTAQRFTKLRGYQFSPVLERRHNHAQVGANRTERRKQAMTAYRVKRGAHIDPGRLYVLCDDIVTTGYSVIGAAKVLQKAGAKHIAVLVLMQQPWHK